MSRSLGQANQEKKTVYETLRSRLWRREVIAAIIICILAVSGVYVQISRYPSVEGRNIVGIIRVEGYIESPSTVSLYTNLINQALLNESVRAVVLTVDSGGGFADYVEEIYHDLLELEAKKPLVASVVTALSGGYYITVAADFIYALPTSFVGNIGVIGSGPPILIPSESVLETGAYKVTGFSPLMFPFNLSRALDNFVSAVQKNRGDRLKLSSTQLKRAMVYLGSEALEVGLVDDLGSMQKAITKAAQSAGLVEYQVVELVALGTGTYQFSQNFSNYTLESRNLTLQALDYLHPPPALHYIYLPPKIITQSSQSPEYPAELVAGEGNVLVDVSHGNQISWWDLDILIAELAKRNATVSLVSQRYDLSSKLANASCLIVASPTEVYTSDECESIRKFVDEGGLLVIFFDPGWEYIGTQGLLQGIIAPINSLSVNFGLSFAKGYLYNEEEHFGLYRNIYVRKFTSSQLTYGLRSLVFFTSTHIRSTGKELAWTSNDTYSSTAEKAGIYATMVMTERGNGTVVALGDLTFLNEPYCYVDDNYQLILNLASLIAKTEVHLEEVEGLKEEVGRPDLPVGTEKNFTEWVDGNERPLRWVKVSETEIRIEVPDQTTSYYLDQDGALRSWVSNSMECIYEVPLPESPFPLTKGKTWSYESNYTLTVEGKNYEGKIVGEEIVEGFDEVLAGDDKRYFCAIVAYKEHENLTYEESNMTMITIGRYWISSDAGTVKQEATTDFYVEGVFTGKETRALLLTSIRKGQGT